MLETIRNSIENFQKVFPEFSYIELDEGLVTTFASTITTETIRGFIRVEYSDEKFEKLDSNLKVVCALSYDIDHQTFEDELLSEVIWSTFYKSINRYNPKIIGGSVTKEEVTTFRSFERLDSYNSYDLRATWVPMGPDITNDLQAFFEAMDKNAIYSSNPIF